jgi:hypothetical protein
MGGVRISEVLGVTYNKFLVFVTPGSNRKVDLCCYFFRRASQLLRPNGCFGLIGTNSVSQGVNQKIALGFVTDKHHTLIQANSTLHWPGSGAVVISIVTCFKGKWKGVRILDNVAVENITPALTDAPTELVHALATNNGLAYVGPFVYGDGFLLEPEQALEMKHADSRNQEVILPYLVGKDINSDPLHKASRFVINFEERSEENAQTYSLPYEHLRKNVYPFRSSKNPPKRDMRIVTQWWKFFHPRFDLMKVLENCDLVCVRSQLSTHHAIAVVASKVVPSHFVIVFLGPTEDVFPLVQSSIHESWVLINASSLGGATNTRYIIRDCFMTFPFPDGFKGGLSNSVKTSGHDYLTARASLMLSRHEGLTKTYNRFHNPDESSEDIDKLRDLHIEMDCNVAAAYGWDDVDLGHGFHETKQGIRFAISEKARREVIQRLLKLNHERYEVEVRQGLHDKKKTKSSRDKKNRKNTDTRQGKFF